LDIEEAELPAIYSNCYLEYAT